MNSHKKNWQQQSDQLLQSTLSPRKRFLFKSVLFLFPILVLALLEVTLRVIDYGGNLHLVTRKKVAGKEYYVINRSVGARYFAHAGTVIPEPADDIFEINKSRNTIRIFCLGESTMAGFPYEFNATAPNFLRDQLQALLPQSKVEVINVGLAAVGSHVVLDFVKELVRYQPDLIIIYLGHNEFYGIYGLGSSIRIPGGRWMIKLTLALLNYRTFALVRSIVGWFKQKLFSQEPTDATLMEQMVREQTIPYGSALYRKAKETYRDNLQEIITTARSNNVPVLFSTLVSNIKDHPPFRTTFSETTTPQDRERWEHLIALGDRNVSKKNFQAAMEAYQRCIELDSLNATAFYKLGLVSYELQEFTESKKLLKRAKDLDALRFRATEEFQQELISICSSNNVPLARVDSTFDQHSPHGIIGQDLMLEHLHPNVKGYFLMGKTFAEAITRYNVLGRNLVGKQLTHQSDEEVWNVSGVTEFDQVLGKIRIDLLKHRWPFTSTNTAYRFIPNDSLEKIVFKYIKGYSYWSEARYELADYYQRTGDYQRARRECLAVLKVIPFSYQPLLRIADYYRMEGKRDSAKAAYARCIQTEDNPYARLKLAIILLEEERPEEAAAQIESAFAVAANTKIQLSSEVLASSYYLLGVAYAKAGKIDLAKANLQKSIAIDPTQEDAKSLLVQLSHLNSSPSSRR